VYISHINAILNFISVIFDVNYKSLMSRIVPFLIVFLLFQSILFAQIPGFTQFNSNNGLPSNTVYDINQDKNGFIWIATDYGLSRFDGLSFKNYTISDGLPDNEILYFFKDSKQRIWLVGFNGKLGYLQNNKFYNSDNQAFLKDLNFNSYASDIFEDSKNNMWFLRSVNNIKKLDTANIVTNYNIESFNKNKKFYQPQIAENIKGEIKILISLTKKNNINEILSSSLINSKWEPINLNLYTKSALLKLRQKKNGGI